jgi:hypothetical protein
MKKTHDYIHYYRGYWSDGGKCRIRIYQEEGRAPVVICSQLPNNHNTSVTNMAEYLAADLIEEHILPTPLIWIEHYPEHEGAIGEYSLVRFSSWEVSEALMGGTSRVRIGTPIWSHLPKEKVLFVLGTHNRPLDAALGDRDAAEERIPPRGAGGSSGPSAIPRWH